MLANLAIGLALWTLVSGVVVLVAARVITFHVREDRPGRRHAAGQRNVNSGWNPQLWASVAGKR